MRAMTRRTLGSPLAQRVVSRYLGVAASRRIGFSEAADFPSSGLFLFDQVVATAARAQAWRSRDGPLASPIDATALDERLDLGQPVDAFAAELIARREASLCGSGGPRGG